MSNNVVPSGGAAGPKGRLDIYAYTTTTQNSLSAGGNPNYITNSGLLVPSTGLKVGGMFFWNLILTKTSAGGSQRYHFQHVRGNSGHYI